MENTGIYHLRLANRLFENNLPVSVVNALKIKRFAQMRMYRIKTDKADTKIIALYGANEFCEPYQPKEEKTLKIRQYMAQIEDFVQMRGQIKNRLEALDNLPYCDGISKELFKQRHRWYQSKHCHP